MILIVDVYNFIYVSKCEFSALYLYSICSKKTSELEFSEAVYKIMMKAVIYTYWCTKVSFSVELVHNSSQLFNICYIVNT